uniref:Mab-21 domain-containing protein n=1 Tax=Macrostomum lignano TaxID=282301 RepID=A0A1I8FT66_9PLAT
GRHLGPPRPGSPIQLCPTGDSSVRVSQASLTHNNIALVYNLATAYSLSSLCSTCLEFLDRNASKILESVLNTSQQQQPISAANSPEPQHLQPHQQQVSLVSSASAGFLSLSPPGPGVQLISRTASSLTNARYSTLCAPGGLARPRKRTDACEKNARKDSRTPGIEAYPVAEEKPGTIRHGAQVTKGEVPVVPVSINETALGQLIDKRGLLCQLQELYFPRGVSALAVCATLSTLTADTKNYDWDSGLHLPPAGAMRGHCCAVVQPYSMSMQLLLWDLDQRAYSYTVDTSATRRTGIGVLGRQPHCPVAPGRWITFSPASWSFVRSFAHEHCQRGVPRSALPVPVASRRGSCATQPWRGQRRAFLPSASQPPSRSCLALQLRTSAAATVAGATYEGEAHSSVGGAGRTRRTPALSRSSSLGVLWGTAERPGVLAAATAMAASAAPSGSQQGNSSSNTMAILAGPLQGLALLESRALCRHSAYFSV